MSIDWGTILTTVGASGLALGVVAFLGRTLLGHLLEKEVRIHAARLEATNTKEIERFRDELRAVAYVRETRFSRWHEQRALAMAELYRRLARAHVAFREFTHPLQVGGEPVQAVSKEKASKLGNEFFECFNENDLFLTTEVSDAAQQLWETMRRTWAEFAADPRGQKWVNAWEEYTKNAALLRGIIRAAMRDVLGGQEPNA